MLCIRKAQPEDAEGIVTVQIDSWRATYKGIIPDAYLDNMSKSKKMIINQSRQVIQDNEHVFFVADLSGQIIGFCGCGHYNDQTQKMGEVLSLYILEEYQKMGIGKKLMTVCIYELQKLGLDSMIIWALKSNQNRYFYHKFGGRIKENRIIDIGGKKLEEVAYVFDDIRKIVI